MVTTFRGGQNTYSTSVAGGSVPPDNRIRFVSDWAMALEPWDTPMLTEIGIGPEYDQRPFYFGSSRRKPHVTNLGAGIAAGATTLTVAAGAGAALQKYMVLSIIDYIPGTTRLDETTKENVWVSAEPATDTLTVARGQGGTTPVAHPAGALIEVIGTAEPQLQFHTLAAVTRGTQNYNEFQRFEGGVKADKAAQNMPTYEHKTNPMLADFEEETKFQKLLLEKAIWRGGRQAGDLATPLPSMMGGFDTFITTNVTNVGNATLTASVLEAEMRDLWKTVDDSAAKRFVMSMDTATIFDTLLNPIRMATVNDTSATLMLERVKFRSGTFNVQVSRHCPDGVIYILDTKQMSVRPFKGLNWHISRKDGMQHAADHDERFISGDFSLEVRNERTMAKIHNFNTDLDQYHRDVA